MDCCLRERRRREEISAGKREPKRKVPLNEKNANATKAARRKRRAQQELRERQSNKSGSGEEYNIESGDVEKTTTKSASATAAANGSEDLQRNNASRESEARSCPSLRPGDAAVRALDGRLLLRRAPAKALAAASDSAATQRTTRDHGDRTGGRGKGKKHIEFETEKEKDLERQTDTEEETHEKNVMKENNEGEELDNAEGAENEKEEEILTGS